MVANASWRAAFARAAKIYGGQTRLSTACGFNRNAIYYAIHHAKKPPAKLAVAIARVTRGTIKLSELLPDAFAARTRDIKRRAKARAA